MKKRILGILLSVAMVAATIVNPMVSAATDTVEAQEIGTYRKADGNHTAPAAPSGMVFAGWYTDDTYTTPIPEDQLTGLAVPKWVDAKVLAAKWQMGATTQAGDSLTKLRLVTTVDSEAYQEVGFVINNGVKDSLPQMSDTVYSSIIGVVNGTPKTYLPNEAFCDASKYFMVFEVGNIPSDVFPSIITVTPQWKTLDGTIVKGTATAFKIKEVLESVMRSATVTTNAGGTVANLADDNYNTEWWRNVKPEDFVSGQDYVQFVWANPVSVNKVIMTVCKSYYTGPNAWHVEVSKDGTSNWTTVASVSDLGWSELGDIKQTSELTFALQVNIKGIRIYIDTNTSGTLPDAPYAPWSGYGIREIEAYNDPTLYDTNYARKATVTTNANDKYNTLYKLTDGNTATQFQSVTSSLTPGQEYIEFKWNNSVSVNKVLMSGTKGSACGVTACHIQVSKDGTNWSDNVYSVSGLSWTAWGDIETKAFVFATRENIKGLRLYIDAANLSWGEYDIFELELYYDLDLNYAPSSTVTSNKSVSNLQYVTDGDYSNTANVNGVTKDNFTPGEHYYQFNWANPVSVNNVVMFVTNARNFAPTAWHIEVSADGETNWTTVASVTQHMWQHLTGGLENYELPFALQENIKGLRVYVDGYNEIGTWGGYGILEFEIYNDVLAN